MKKIDKAQKKQEGTERTCKLCKREYIFDGKAVFERICPGCFQLALTLDDYLAENAESENEDQRKSKGKRVCLKCDEEFDSEGIYNRIYPSCREKNANLPIYYEGVGTGNRF